MRRIVMPTLIVLGATLATGAFANEADFTLKNRTGYQIDEVYISPHSSRNWGRDRMGNAALADSHSIDIRFPRGAQACRFDIKVKYHDDGSIESWGDVDLCGYNTILLYWDAAKQVTDAIGE
jgi:hypothetical protein